MTLTEKNFNTLIETIIAQHNIYIKNIKTFRAHEQMEGYSCDLFYKGNKIAYCFNDARGGELEISPYTFGPNSLYKELQSLFESYPTYHIQYPYGDKVIGVIDIEQIVFILIDKFKEQKLIKQNASKGIIFKNKEGKIMIKKWKNVSSLALLIQRKPIKGKQEILISLKQIENQGNEILNRSYLNTICPNE